MSLLSENPMRLRRRSYRQGETVTHEPNRSLPARAHCGISDILCAVRNSILFLTFLLAASAAGFVLCALPAHSSPQEGAAQPAPQPPAQVPAVPSTPSEPIIVLDPGHGGTDTGARGEGGAAAEKEIVLHMAQTIRAELERQGYHVVMTRNDDSNPSYDDRAALANSHRDAIFISLHVSSTGTAGIVRVYFDQFATPISPSVAADSSGTSATLQTGSLTVWEEAQRPYVDTSRHFGDLIQAELAKAFAGSPSVSTGAAVRVLRSVAAPAVAIEVSSVSTSSQDSLMASAAPIASAIARSVSIFRQTTAAGAKQ
jgi:N-acetylmuramoyl-L-alanine amidase